MWFLIILAASSLLCAGNLAAQARPPEISRWQTAYSGDWALSHKLYLVRPANCLDDRLLNLFYLSYAYYKSDQLEGIARIFEVIDSEVKEKITP